MPPTPADPHGKIDELIDVLAEMLVATIRWKQTLEDGPAPNPSGAAVYRIADGRPGG